MSEPLLTTRQAAERVGVQEQSIFTWLFRHKIRPVAREAGKHGQNLFRAADIDYGLAGGVMGEEEKIDG